MRTAINYLYNIFILVAIAYHVWTCYLVFKVEGLVPALLSGIIPLAAEIYWIYNWWGLENYQTYINCGIGVAVAGIIFTVLGRD
ncbi:MAG: hypothetical protein EAZ47_06840 [Bacteroidetes bacterium]|jgi:hypothetical protein|nr:MAG: hypothetical protein EAY72_01150 [Bacteroidota bacterium]TAF93315.1 MAG: hypothetical protein EAZ47_06840 [Bacteroidota bacterium]